MRKTEIIRSITAMNLVGLDWGGILHTSPIVNDERFREDLKKAVGEELEKIEAVLNETGGCVDCTDFFHRRGLLLERERIAASSPVRAYVEYVLHYISMGLRPETPDEFLFDDPDKDARRVRKTLEKILAVLTPGEFRDKLAEWVDAWKT